MTILQYYIALNRKAIISFSLITAETNLFYLPRFGIVWADRWSQNRGKRRNHETYERLGENVAKSFFSVAIQAARAAERAQRAQPREQERQARESAGLDDMDTYADDLAELVKKLDLTNAIHVGHSTGGGEVARYMARHGTERVAKAVLIGAVPPLMLKTPANPGGLPIEVFDKLRASVKSDRSLFWKELAMPFYGYNRPGAEISEGVCDSFWMRGQMAGFPAAYFCIKAFSETGQTGDLKKIDVPTLIIQGDDDQIVPFPNSGQLQAKLIKGAALKVYKGAPHGLCTTHKNEVNADLLAFIQG